MTTIAELEKELSKLLEYSVGIDINIVFSYELQRWDMQLVADTLIKMGSDEKTIKHRSNCLDIDRIFLDNLDVSKEIASELHIMWYGLTRRILKYLEDENILMGQEEFFEYMEGKLEKTKERRDSSAR